MIRELKRLSQIIIKRYDLTPIDIQFKPIQRGHAYWGTRKITMPIWIFTRVKEYQHYYMIHELTHFILRDKFDITDTHGEAFKKLQNQILKDYNIIPIYNKAYPKELRNLEGKKLCGRFGLVTDL